MMTKNMRVSIPGSPQKSYPVYVGQGLLKQLPQLINFERFSKIAIVAGRHTAKHWLPSVTKVVPRALPIVITTGERNKTLKTAEIIWQKLLKAGFDRHSLMITLGGGVTSDLAGFAAGTYMRGVSVLHLPTTLIGQAEAAIGGKTAVNFGGLKNMVGAFHQPIGVIADVTTLRTLPKRHVTAGFAEIIKQAIMSDGRLFNFATSQQPAQFSEMELVRIIGDSCRIKARVVEKDEREAGLRKTLNFGHTIGHAIESLSLATSRPLLHGEAVSIGMVAENRLAQSIGCLSKTDADTIEFALAASGLPTRFPQVKRPGVLAKLQLDKKNERGKILWSVPTGIGNGISDQEAPLAAITKAIDYIMQ